MKQIIEQQIIEKYYNYITRRNLNIKIKGSKAIWSSDTGFPQEGVDSAKFWIKTFNEAIEILNTHAVYGSGFADECVEIFLK